MRVAFCFLRGELGGGEGGAGVLAWRGAVESLGVGRRGEFGGFFEDAGFAAGGGGRRRGGMSAWREAEVVWGGASGEMEMEEGTGEKRR